MIGQFGTPREERSKACFIIFTLSGKVSYIKWRLNYSKAKYADVLNHIASMQVNNATTGYDTEL